MVRTSNFYFWRITCLPYRKTKFDHFYAHKCFSIISRRVNRRPQSQYAVLHVKSGKSTKIRTEQWIGKFFTSKKSSKKNSKFQKLFSKGRITRQYAREFEKCMSPEFVDLGIESARSWFETLTVPIYQRSRFRIVIAFTSLSIISVLTLLACIKRARQRIDLNQEKGILFNKGA